MLNQLSIKAVENGSFDHHFCRPLYENYCFSRLPGTIHKLLTGEHPNALPQDVFPHPNETYECLITILIDGFGWRFLKKYMDELPFLSRFMQEGVVSQMTSQFPSTTVAHLTCLHTGLPVGQSGLFEWYYYEPLVDSIIVPLRYVLGGDLTSQPLINTGATPESLFPFTTIYQDLARQGIESTTFYHRSYASSPFSQRMGRGSTIVPYSSCAEGVFMLSELIQKKPRGYYYIYLGDVDSASHQYGPESPEIDRTIRENLAVLEKRLGSHPVVNSPKTAMIVTADHGQIATDPATTIYINKLFPEMIEWMKKDFKGRPLAPCGSPRDYFLYIRDEYLEKAYNLLQISLEEKAAVYYTRDLIERGIFGPQPLSERFYQRMGNIAILPFKGQTVFWYEQGRFENLFYGNHGGLTREEMESIFLFKAGS